MSEAAQIGIFYHSDLVGHVPSGVDSFIRGILEWAPEDLDYTLFGATSDIRARPVGVPVQFALGGRSVQYVPVVAISGAARKGLVPDTLRYMRGLSSLDRGARLTGRLQVLDFHRIEPLWLFRHDARPRNLVLHQDMSVLREPGCDIKWRHAPWAYEWIERHTFAMVQSVSVVRESAVARYRARYPEQADKFRFLPTWFDPGTFRCPADGQEARDARQRLRNRHSIGAECPVLVFVGRFDSQKDPLLLLEAAGALQSMGRDFHLLMVGDGILRTAVRERITARSLGSRVTLAGVLGREEIAAMLRGADAFVLSSAYEGMPIAVLEALACGLPVVATDVGELHRVVTPGVNGQRVAERSAAALARAIAGTLDARSRLAGAPCRDSVAAFTPQQVLAPFYAQHRAQAARPRSGR